MEKHHRRPVFPDDRSIMTFINTLDVLQIITVLREGIRARNCCLRGGMGVVDLAEIHPPVGQKAKNNVVGLVQCADYWALL